MGLTILAVEDDFVLRSKIAEFLENKGFSVMQAGSCADAKRVLAAQTPDLVLMDLGLPDGSGQELIPLIRNISSSLPIIVITVMSAGLEMATSLSVGATLYLEKPVDIHTLSQIINSMLANLRSKPSPLRLDKQAKILYYNGTPIKLTRSECRIVDLLIAKPGQIVYYDEISEAIWNTSDGLSNESAIHVHINRIRDKLVGITITNRSGDGYILNLP